VFIRELISNASDALEKLRYNQLSEVMPFPTDHDHGKLEIRISTDKQNRILTIQVIRNHSAQLLGLLLVIPTKFLVTKLKNLLNFN
jgi:Molecular chaperone, HSP90 family